MNVAVLQFPGSNCDFDAFYALQNTLHVAPEFIWHKEKSLGRADAVIIPGGFSFGDYLRCGAVARFSPIMQSVIEFAAQGRPILGICNGFQILCEAHLLPGALIRNDCIQFQCKTVSLEVEDIDETFNTKTLSRFIALPIAHGEGNYRIEEDELQSLKKNKQILFRYTTGVNGSLDQIAGIRNSQGNVWGMMPHPERAVEWFHPSQDGIAVLKAFLQMSPAFQEKPSSATSHHRFKHSQRLS